MGCEALERVLTDLSGGTGKVSTREGRQTVAAAFGYIDARLMVFFLETHGYPLSLAAMQAAKHGLRVDFSGLDYELKRINKKPETIESELNEIRYFVANVKLEGTIGTGNNEDIQR